MPKRENEGVGGVGGGWGRQGVGVGFSCYCCCGGGGLPVKAMDNTLLSLSRSGRDTRLAVRN